MRCNLCIRKCNIDRDKSLGFCNSKNKIKIAKSMLYPYEEPCISGINGSGVIFFSGCNMRCIYCQNYEISHENYGKEINELEFANICLELQEKGAHNINLITPGHFIHLIVKGLNMAKKMGLNVPIVYNTNGMETVDSIKMLNGLIDIYLPDYKYYEDIYSIKYSVSKGYSDNIKNVIDEMYKQVGKNIFEDNIMIKGVLARHLLIPTLKDDSKKIIKYLYDTYHDNIYLSIMNQYTPIKKYKYDELNKTITNKEYEDIIDYAYNLGIRNCYVQEEGTNKKSFIPNFKE